MGFGGKSVDLVDLTYRILDASFNCIMSFHTDQPFHRRFKNCQDVFRGWRSLSGNAYKHQRFDRVTARRDVKTGRIM